MTQVEILAKTFNQMDNIFTSNEFINLFLQNGGDKKLTHGKVLKYIKSNATQEDPLAIRARTWIKNNHVKPAQNIAESDLIDYLRENKDAEQLCIRFLKHRGYRILKNMEVEL